MTDKALKAMLHREARMADAEADSGEREDEGWLLVYLDVMTLLLVMLVVLLAFSSRVVGLGAADPRPLIGREGVLPGTTGILEALPALEPVPESVPDVMREGLPPDPLDGLALDGLGDDVEVVVESAAIRLRISSEILFPSGQAQLTTQGLAVLDAIIGVIQGTPFGVTVEGHTDDVPIQTERFPSNWELSTGRATSVVRHLAASGIDPARLRATGYADTRPIAPNELPATRAANRRVELILESRAP